MAPPKYRQYLHDIEALRSYLATDFVAFVQYHLEYEEGFRIGDVQREIAEFLQAPGREKLIIAFRGLGKTYTVKYYAGWRHLRVPTAKIKFVSDNLGNAQKMAKAYLNFLKSSPVMQKYAPKTTRLSRTRFDLDLVTPEKDPSVDCIGIDGSITSTRADLIIADDVENIDNSNSVPLRENLLWKLSEFQAVLHPAGRFIRDKKTGFVLSRQEAAPKVARIAESCQLVYIGTYQHLKSIWLPTTDKEHPLLSVQRLVIPALKRKDEDRQALPIDGIEGRYVSAWPERFSTVELLERRRDGAKFALDFLCDVAAMKAEARVIRMSAVKTSDELTPRFLYCMVDPAQGGHCETAAAFGGPIDNRLYVSDILAWKGEATTWIPELVKACKARNVAELHVEAKPETIIGFIQQEIYRQGGGMVLRSIVPKGDKTLRLTGTLEYPINSGHVVFSTRVLQDALTREQLENLTYEKIDKNAQVDRLDALAHLVAAFGHHLGGRGAPAQSARFG